MRYLKLSLIVILALTISAVGVAFAEEEEDPSNNLAYFRDGRVNSWEQAAPVAIFCNYTFTDPNAAVSDIAFDNIEVYLTNSGQKAVSVEADQISSVLAGADGAALLAEGEGVQLFRVGQDAFQVNAFQPDGKPYQFSWERGELC